MKTIIKQMHAGFIRWFDSDAGTRETKDRKFVSLVRSVPFVAVHLAIIAVIWVGWSPIAVGVAAFLYFLRMFAITGFYHRYFSHRSFKAGRVMQFLFGLLGCTAVQRGPLWWAAHHRVHHRFSDKEQDLHSPVKNSFWTSHVAWIFKDVNFRTHYEKIKDFAKFPELRWLNRFDLFVTIGFAALIFASGEFLNHLFPQLGTNGWQMLIWGFAISTVVLWHATFLVNSLAHVIGKKVYKTDDESRNNWWIAMLTLGEGWHNNHHRFPAAARQGFVWWEIDITYYILKGMSFLGLVWDLKKVPKVIIEERYLGRRVPRTPRGQANT